LCVKFQAQHYQNISEYNEVIQLTLKVILNVDLLDIIWRQATIPVSSGGLGVRFTMDLALTVTTKV